MSAGEEEAHQYASMAERRHHGGASSYLKVKSLKDLITFPDWQEMAQQPEKATLVLGWENYF